MHIKVNGPRYGKFRGRGGGGETVWAVPEATTSFESRKPLQIRTECCTVGKRPVATTTSPGYVTGYQSNIRCKGL